MKQKRKITTRVALIRQKASNMKKALERLRGSVIYYKDPYEPVGLDHWEALK